MKKVLRRLESKQEEVKEEKQEGSNQGSDVTQSDSIDGRKMEEETAITTD